MISLDAEIRYFAFISDAFENLPAPLYPSAIYQLFSLPDKCLRHVRRKKITLKFRVYPEENPKEKA